MRCLFAAAIAVALAVPLSRADDTKTDKNPQQQLKDLQSEYSKERAEIMKEMQAAEAKDRGKIYVTKTTELNAKLAPKFLELAKANLGDDTGYTALAFVFQNGSTKLSSEAMTLLLEKYESKLVAAPAMLEQAGPKGEQALRELLTKHADGDDSVKLSYSLANMIFNQTEHAPPSAANEGKMKEAEQLFEAIAAKGKDGSREVTEAKGFLNEIRNLQVGKVIPDLQSEDLDGKKVKLSDYRGKIVVLDIWATWCGPCKAMIPHEREMVEKLKGKPFVLLSVSCDEKKETLTKFLEEKEKMPWAHWWDGRGGPVTKAIHLRYYPTIYVLDHKGTIRYKGVRGDKMDEAVETLLKEIETSQ
jgi:thiol-disulfide isomerase/thioredoxin